MRPPYAKVITTGRMCSYRWGNTNFENVDSPCKDCIDRSPTCHSGCSKYDEYKEIIAKRKEARMKSCKKHNDYRFSRKTMLYGR